MHELLPRPRLAELLERPDARRIQLLCAPPGYGVTTALRTFCSRPGAVYVALRDGTSLPRFAGDLVEALAGQVPGMQMTLTAAYERALSAGDPTAALAGWFRRHAAGRHCIVALDHIQNAAHPDVTRFIADIVERSPETFRWLLGSNSLDDLPVASWLAYGFVRVPLDARELGLSRAEATDFAAVLAPELAPGTVGRLHESTRGSVEDFVFLLRARQSQSGIPESADIDTLIRRRFEALPRRERTALLRTALVPSLDDATLVRMSITGLSATFQALRVSEPQFFDDGGRRYHGRFRRFLQARLAGWTRPRRSAVAARTAAALEAGGDLAGALDLYISIKRQREILRLVENHGFRPMHSGIASILHDALAAVDPEAQQRNPAVLTLRALSASLHGTTDVAEALFQHALSSCRTPAETLQVRYLYAIELLRRGRLDAIGLLQPDETFLAAPEELRVATMASLGVAYAMDDRSELAAKWIARALRDVPRIGDGAVRARVYQQASYVALASREFDSATRFAARAAKVGNASGEFEVAASACSVLYSVAADFDDDPGKAASYLSRIASYGAKCGSIEKQLMAWVAAYEIEAERGDRTAVAAIERELGEFDLHYSARLPSEGLLPAQVLQATWSGDFTRAYRTLSASVHQLQTADREALRWAEIAVYAVAAGEIKEAAAAVIAALRKLKRAPATAILTLRARLYCALAFVLLGREAAPRIMLAAVRRDIPPARPRLDALYAAVYEVSRLRAGERNHAALWSALESLRANHFGGIAQMFEALPAHLLRDSPSGAKSA